LCKQRLYAVASQGDVFFQQAEFLDDSSSNILFKITDAAGIWRYAKPAHPKQYIETLESGDLMAGLRPVAGPELLFEYLLNTVRLQDDINALDFAARTGAPADLLRARLRQPLAAGLMESTGDNSWRVTALGRRFLNDLQAEFLPE